MDVLIGWPGGDWQATAQLAATLVGGYLFILWTTSVLWVYRDIQQRTRDPVSQLTAVAISIVFPLISLPIYAALRPSETLQDSYLRLLEREVLLSELGAMQGGGEPRRAASRANSIASTAAAEVAATPQAAQSQAGAPVVGDSPPARTTTRPEPVRSVRTVAAERVRGAVTTEQKRETPQRTATDEAESGPDTDESETDRAERNGPAADLA